MDYNTGKYKDDRYRDAHRGDSEHALDFSIYTLEEEAGIGPSKDSKGN